MNTFTFLFKPPIDVAECKCFRAILTKKKNRYFIALFLDKHKYYESKRKELGI